LTLTCEQPEPQNTISGKVELVILTLLFYFGGVSMKKNAVSALLFPMLQRKTIQLHRQITVTQVKRIIQMLNL
jgi:hypothetical protein